MGEHAGTLPTPNFSVNKPSCPHSAGGIERGRLVQSRWGISWQITPRVLTDALATGGAEAKLVFAAMMEMGKIDIAKIEAARRG